MKSNRLFGLFSYRRAWKFPLAVGVAKYTTRHSMLKMRLGAVPDTEVKIPHVPPGKPEQPDCASVRKSDQRGKTVYANEH
jgi:hypothetical protein